MAAASGCAVGGEKSNWGWRLGRAGVGWLQDAASHARAPTARGLRSQASGDEWRHAASGF